MRQRRLVPLPCVGGELRPLQPQQQLEVDVQAAAVEIAAADADDVVHHQ